jgi:phage portal protein BeeE
MLLGIPGDNTYSNYAEANRSFWRQTVLPLVNRTAKALSAWLAPGFAGTASAAARGFELRPDLDAIEALSTEREALWERVRQSDFLTVNEKRAAVGYGALPGGDVIAAQAPQ